MELFKVQYKYYKDYAQGGNGVWIDKTKIYFCGDCELPKLIEDFIKDNDCGYRRCTKLVNVERL